MWGAGTIISSSLEDVDGIYICIHMVAQLASQHARPIVAAYIWCSRVGMYTRLGASVA